MDPLGNACRDEPATAVLALIEGSAQYFSLKVLIDSGSITFEDLDTLIQEVLGSSFSPVDAEPFLLQQLYFPYQDGLEFVQALEARGGTAAVNAAFQHPPVTTEQVIHPEKYPSDRPERLDIPDLAPGLGQDWGDLDVMQVGEDFLREALRLVEPADQADAAAAGWDGGIYRAWTNGSSVAVVLRTAWDTSADAQEFADATGPWLDGLDARVTVDGTRVDVIFGTDEQTFASLRSAVGQR
jgi:hypothetical protein